MNLESSFRLAMTCEFEATMNPAEVRIEAIQ